MSYRGGGYHALYEPHIRVLTPIFLNLARQAYLRVQLGINALDGARYEEATDHFTSAVKNSPFPSESAIHSKYEDFAVVR